MYSVSFNSRMLLVNFFKGFLFVWFVFFVHRKICNVSVTLDISVCNMLQSYFSKNEIKYCVGQKVHLGFSIRCYGIT